jgi:hypothetical protein
MTRVLVAACADSSVLTSLSDYYKDNDVVGNLLHRLLFGTQKLANLSRALRERFTCIRRSTLEMHRSQRVAYVFHVAVPSGVRASWGANFAT